jgi:hypothetical protein
MKQIDKPYERAFLLEPTKLIRLIDKIHERLGDHQHTTTHDSFEVFLSDKRHEKMTSVDEVLALENSRKHEIQRLLIVCSAATKGAVHPEHEIQVDFGKMKMSGSTNTKIIEVSVRSEFAGWAERALSEVEEQVERTRLHHRIPVGGLIALLICMLVIVLSQFVTVGHTPRREDAARVMWLSNPDLDHVEQILSQNRTITEQEMREIATRQLRNVLEDQRPKRSPQKTWTRQRILVGVPLVILFVCVIILFNCYPDAVFLWGDEVERYATIVQWRKNIWNVIIIAMVVGVVANLFSTSLVSWLPPE